MPKKSMLEEATHHNSVFVNKPIPPPKAQLIKTMKIGSFNSNGADKNIDSLYNQAHKTNILFACELWNMNHQKVENNIFLINKKIYSKPTTRKHLKGRPSGGMAFIVDSSIASVCNFPNSRIGALTTGSLTIIGVYLAYYGGNNKTKLITLKSI